MKKNNKQKQKQKTQKKGKRKNKSSSVHKFQQAVGRPNQDVQAQ